MELLKIFGLNVFALSAIQQLAVTDVIKHVENIIAIAIVTGVFRIYDRYKKAKK